MWSVSTQKRLFGSGVKQMIIHTQFLQDEKQIFPTVDKELSPTV